MAKYLVIVESPGKTKSINRYLGRDYAVRSSVGHIRDLPSGGREQAPAERAARTKLSPAEQERTKRERARTALVRRMGVDPEHGWEARYEILPGKEKVLRELRKQAEAAEVIYLATDLDREGEAIAWHLREAIGGDPERFVRVTFSEITKRAIQEAFADPGALDMDRVNAQQARRFLDRVVGFMVSPVLWKTVGRGLSAGRVQSVAVRLIVEREREIHAFVPEEYWEVAADLAAAAGRFTAAVARKDDRSYRPTNQEAVTEDLARLRSATFVVDKREDKPKQTRPYPPFITSSLQQAASLRFHFGVKKTMTLAQRLYEAGLITYMRTDSTHLSADAVAACRQYISATYGERYLPAEPNVYASRASAQEAHEAIRPADVTVAPEQVSGVDADAVRLYALIRDNFIACQMPSALYDTTSVTISADVYQLRVSGRIMRFDGWMRVLPPARKDGADDAHLPEVAEGETLDLRDLRPSQHFTKPPARFSEANLVRELEKRGIGRPSTYAAIISTIQERGYVRLAGRRFYAEKMGDIVTDRLSAGFPDLLNYGFTAGLEDKLDGIAKGDLRYTEVLDAFYSEFKEALQRAESGDSMRPVTPTPTDIPCPTCGRPLHIRTARTGVFLGCSGYQLPPAERCTTTVNLIPGDEAVAADADEEGEGRDLRRRRRCPLCGTAMDSYLIDETRKLHVCGNNPDCPGNEVETGTFKIKGYDGPTITCDRCGAPMELKSGRFGKYFGCSTYPDCKNSRKLLRNGEVAPPKADPVPMPELACEKSDGHFVLRDGAAGLFLASSKYPRSRETRNPQVADLQRHREELDAKHHYLAEAPAADADGHPFVIRFSRKAKEQYITSEDAQSKPTGWVGHWRDGAWQIERAAKSDRKTAGSSSS